MSKTSFTTTALASIFLLAAASFGVSTAANAQQQPPLQDQFKNEPAQEQGAQPDEASGMRAAQEVEEEFSDDQAATRADEDDNLPENTQRLMILDSRGRPYMYDGVRDGVVCRARRVLVRRNAWGTGTYRRTISCRSGASRPRYNQNQYNQYGQPYNQSQYNQYGQPYNPPYFRN
jgi:guanyl-specific ribonuclease Sa